MKLQVNFNNAFIKLPKLKPLEIVRIGQKALKITNPNHKEFAYSKMFISINNIYTINTTQEVYEFQIPSELLNNKFNFYIKITGLNSKYLQVYSYTITKNLFTSVCSEDLICSEDLVCSD